VPRRHRGQHGVHGDVAQFSLNMAAGHKAQAACIEGGAFCIEHKAITRTHRKQGSPTRAVLCEAESFARNTHRDGDCAAAALCIAHSSGNTRELA